MAVVPHGGFGKDVCEVFGLDAVAVRELTIHIKVAEIVSITAVIMPNKNQLDEMVALLRVYELRLKQELVVPVPVSSDGDADA